MCYRKLPWHLMHETSRIERMAAEVVVSQGDIVWDVPWWIEAEE